MPTAQLSITRFGEVHEALDEQLDVLRRVPQQPRQYLRRNLCEMFDLRRKALGVSS